MAGWERIEAMARAKGLSGGLEARIADPLWFLARQWQVGEFQGDDAAQPAVARFAWRSLPLTSYRPGPGGSAALAAVPLPPGRPLEALAEATAEPDLGSGGLHASVRAGRRLTRLLRDAGLVAGAESLGAAFRLASPAHQVEAGILGRAQADLLVRRGLDGAAVALAGPARVGQVLGSRLAGADLARARVVVDGWLTWYQARGGPGSAPGPSWDSERIGYRFSVAAPGPSREVTLIAPDHDGGHLDWYSFDLAGPAEAHGLDPAPATRRSRTAIPTPVRYAGMPASRFWEFEDGQVHFGDLDAGPADLARLLVAELATTYGDDMFVLPLPVQVGTLTELTGVEVLDTFGGRTQVPSAASVDASQGGARVWRLFELRGDELDEQHRSPWLFVPPTLAGSQEGATLERVALARDEAANLGWGIEQLVEGPFGRGVDRAAAWASGRHKPPSPTAHPTGPDDVWRYRLEANAPPWWVPLVAERIDPHAPEGEAAAQVRLRRARMRAWDLLVANGDGQVGPKSALLDPRVPRWLAEARVPVSGLRVERAWQLARWHDGSLHTWLRYRVTPGRKEAASGIRWDLLDRGSTPGGKA